MATRATDGTCLAVLVRMAKPLCQSAERVALPRRGPGRPPLFADWAIALLIMVCVLRKKKSKSSQYRFIQEHRAELTEWIGLSAGLPRRSAFFARYRRAWKPYEVAIRLQGGQLVRCGLVDATGGAGGRSLSAGR